MTSTSTPNPAIMVVPNPPSGIVRLFVPSGIDVGKSELRQAAAKVAHTIDVGRTPAPKIATYKGVKGSGYDFSPVVKGKTADAPAPDAPADDPRVVTLRRLGLTDAQIAEALAAFTTAPTTGKGKGTSKGKGGTAKTAVPSFIAQRAQRREAQAAQCGKCLGFGKIRATERTAKKTGLPVRYPWAFRTLQGANGAPTGRPCDACGGAAKTA